jgi:LacI family transcriptional regulator
VATIRDVAREAGVSVSTVSRVIMESNSVREDTRARVQKVIERLDFRPSAIARGLVSKKTKTLGVVVSDISNPFYPQVIKGIEDVANESGYTIILTNTDDSLERHSRALDALQQQRVAGLILGSVRRDDPVVPEVIAEGVPTVLVNRGLPRSGTTEVVLDNRRGAELATKHLLELGRTRLVHFAGPPYAQNARERTNGFRSAARDAGLTGHDALIVEVGFHPVAASGAADEVIKEALSGSDRHADGILAVDDIVALRAMEIARFELGLRVPEDVAIVGFDDSHLVASRFVEITTVWHRPYEMGVEAARLLLGRIEGSAKKWPRKVVLEPELIVRASTVGSFIEAIDA